MGETLDSEDQWRDVVTEHYQAVFALCTHLTGSRAHGADATQEVFLRAWRNRSGAIERGISRAWLFTIARNYCADQRKWSRRFLSFLIARNVPKVGDHEGEVATLKLSIRKAVAELPRRQREVFVLRHWHGMSTREVATHLGIDEGTVKSSLSRAVAALRKLLDH